MTVQLAPIRPHDLRAGDILQWVAGGRWRLVRHVNRAALGGRPGWIADSVDTPFLGSHIPDVDIERTGPHRLWWLDSCSERD